MSISAGLGIANFPFTDEPVTLPDRIHAARIAQVHPFPETGRIGEREIGDAETSTYAHERFPTVSDPVVVL